MVKMCENCTLVATNGNLTVIIEKDVPDCDDYFDFIEQNENTPAKVYREMRTPEITVGFKLKATNIPALLFECKELQKTKNIELFIKNINFFEPFEVKVRIYYDENSRKCLSFTKT